MKKSLALVLALVMVLSSFSFVSAASYSDVAGTMYEEPVARLSKLEVLKGYPDGSFKPEGSITRAEFAAVAVRARGLAKVAEAAAGLPSGFVDVPAAHWAAGYVGTAGSMGIVNGIGNGMFAPNALVKYEEAVTMLVRALGYETDAQAKGGYPYGYLIVAEEIGLLDGARSTQGVWATRGLVAKLTDNALEIPMMIAIGTGADARWIVSGEDRTEEVYLLDFMGFDVVEGRVVSYSSSKDTIKVGNKTLDVEEGFDFYAVHGAEIKAWVDGDMVIVFTVKEDIKFDAVEYDADEEVTLITEDENYTLAMDEDDDVIAELWVNGEKLDAEDYDDFYADYAKIVLNDDGDIIWAEGYDFNGFIVVEDVDKDIIADMNDEELDIEDYMIVKNGMTISADDLAKGDVVFYNEGEEFAVVYNKVTEGVVTRAYTTSFRLDTTTYDLAFDAMFIDGKTMDFVDADVLSAFEDEEGKVKVFVDFYGDVVLMVGSRGEAAKSTYGALLTSDANVFENARTGKEYIAWDMVDEMGEEVSFDESTDLTVGTIVADKWDVVEYTIEDDGDLDKVEVLTPADIVTDGAVEVKDRYAAGYRLQSTTVVFMVEDVEDDVVDEVFMWADAEDFFGEMQDFVVYADGGDVTYLLVTKSDAGDDFDEEAGVLMKVKALANGDFETTINIGGTNYVFDLEDDYSDWVGLVVEFEVNADMDEILDGVLTEATVVYGEYDTVSLRSKTFTIDGTEYKLDSAAVVFEAYGTVAKIDMNELDSYLEDGDVFVMAFMDDGSNYYVKYLIAVEPMLP